MKNLIACAVVATMACSSVNAGGFAEPMMEPEVIVEEASASSGGFLIPLLLLALLIAINSGGDDVVKVR